MTREEQQNEFDRPRVISDPEEMRNFVHAQRGDGRTVGLVPTMGALHEGHLSLVRQSVADTDVTVVTIFVNPTQFGPNEDLSEYPRTFDADLEMLALENADVVFFPANNQMYPNGFSTFVQPPAVSEPLEGRCRPGHFRGVATIVLKLFNIIPADVAFFGQKDYQQSRVIERMVCDLDLPIRIEVCPIIREPDGLAMSSRNRYMNDAERQQATALVRSLRRAVELTQQSQRDPSFILSEMRSILETAGIERIEYVALVDPATMADVDHVTDGTIALVAAYVGETRLIDNCRIG